MHRAPTKLFCGFWAGKSTMAGYFIDLLKSHVLYFFCQRGRNGLKSANNIIQTLAYQFAIAYPKVRSILEHIANRDLSSDKVGGVEGLFRMLIDEPLEQISTTDFFPCQRRTISSEVILQLHRHS